MNRLLLLIVASDAVCDANHVYVSPRPCFYGRGLCHMECHEDSNTPFHKPWSPFELVLSAIDGEGL